ncbi:MULTISPECIES: ABC transporter permease [Arthrobacter]|uniref:Transport permease protein n=2 Tax=Arthrobacter TaxID=1663 RepID=A0ABU9KLX1_9MICC|nr:ABC transporter permease [Arthrobacter sp. YJM1]MDP5227233.1 ABC transporter permease [Arthrobacter sp. YJM1]
MSTTTEAPLVRPGVGRGLADVFRDRYLLRLLVGKELKIRYRGSALGLLWSYVKPGVQFVVFYIAMGKFLQLEKATENYAVYLFSGIVLVNFFGEALSNGARSIVYNAGLIKKIYLPREMFPVASVWVSGVHFIPQVAVLLVGCFVAGWRPDWISLLAAVGGFLIIAMFALGLALLFSAINVFFRDVENIVDLLLMVATWASPVMYKWDMVQKVVGDFWFTVYQINPLTVAVELFHRAFWAPTTPGDFSVYSPPNLLTLWLPFGLVISAAVLLLGQLTFRRVEHRFAQEL